MNKCRLLPSFGAAMALCASCSDDVPAIPDSELFVREFVKEFGAYDVNHDWNMAQQTYVDVTTERPSRIKITAMVGDTRYLLANYADVQGHQRLKFDIPKGITEIRVSDERYAYNASIGQAVDFSASGRAIWEKEDDVVKITRTDYRLLTEEGVTMFSDYLPEDHDNLGKVTQNFTFIANGDFTVYPVYWNTSAYNTLGIYYIDEEKNEMVHIPFYTNKITPVDGTKGNLLYTFDEPEAADLLPALPDLPVRDGKTFIVPNSENSMFSASLNPADYNSSGKTSFLDFNGEDWKTFKRRWLIKQRETLCTGNFPIDYLAQYFDFGDQLELRQFWSNKMHNFISDVACVAEDANHVRITNIAMGPLDTWTYPSSAVSNAHPDYGVVKAWKSRGIHVSIKPGTKFGMFLRNWRPEGDASDKKPSIDNVGVVRLPLDPVTKRPVRDEYRRFYSEAFYNVDIEDGVQTDVFASTFMMDTPTGTYRVLGFEDWGWNKDQIDLNDMIFFIHSDEPTKIPDVEDVDHPKMSWLLAVEDMGVKDDFDFNDLVIKVEHAAGEETATITPVAAGGTLPMRMFYKGQEIGGSGNYAHINQFFGINDPGIMINTGRANATAESVEIAVDKDFTMASLQGVVDGKMGGFHVQVKRDLTGIEGAWTEDKDVINITPGQVDDETIGATPQILCLPSAWRWPRERVKISDAYPRITDWFKNKDTNTDWYLYPNENRPDLVF